MNKIIFIVLFFFTIGTATVFAQTKTDAVLVAKDSLKSNDIDPLTPAKAAFFSAVLPGLGQAYNKKYWKIPIVWGGIGTGIGITLWNQKQYTRYRNAFIAQLNGQPHEFSEIPGISAEALGRTQDRAQRQRDYAIAVTALIYVLNIVDAVVDAHLYEGRKDPDLALKPTVIFDEFSENNSKAGLSLSYNF